MERVELHFHLLPGVDDGPEDLSEALELARQAVADGTGLVICTPHVRAVDVGEIPGRVRELRAALGRAGIGLEIGAGAELAWDDLDGLDGTALDGLAHGPVGRRWLLLEAPLPGTGELGDFETAARELRDRGFGLLIGHPERSPAVTGSPGAVERLLAAGDRLQVNGSSLTGRHGVGPCVAGLELVRAGHVTVIASDAHRPTSRRPVLGDAVSVLRLNGIDAGTAQRLTAANPGALLERGLAPAGRLAA